MMLFRRGLRLPARDPWLLALLIVFLAALALRLYGLDWDDGADLHPDELFIAKIVLIDRIHISWPPDWGTLLDPARSGLNPRSVDPATGQYREFAYGALPLWVTDFVAWVLSRLTGVDWNGMDHAYLVGRAISALLSALTVLPIAALGVAVGGRAVGLLAALFAALAPMSIQLGHFFTTDSWLTFFVTCCLLACVLAAQVGSAKRFAVAGATFGLAMATKGSVFTLAVPIAAAVAIDAARRWQPQMKTPPVRAALIHTAAAAVAAFVAFGAFEPYALLRPAVYLQSLKTQADIVSGRFDVPFTRVYAGTTPVGYQLEQFVRWGYGPMAGVLALAGVVLLVLVALRQRTPVAIVLLAWFVTYGTVLVVADVKFLRYLEPLAPVFAVGAGLALARVAAATRSPRFGAVLKPIPLLALILAIGWTAAFMTIYAHENPRLAASRWIYATVPPGSTLTAEYWDDALPRSLGYAFSPATAGLGTISLDLYRDLPPAEATDAIYDDIAAADNIVQSSQRVEAAVDAAPWRYPVQERYFNELERDALGFTRIAAFARMPALGPLLFDDRHADESFINYDHPRVAIYRRTEPPSRVTYDDAMSWALQRPWNPGRAPERLSLLLPTPVGENPAVNDARWSAPVTSATPAALAVWLVLLLVLLAIGYPIARQLLPGFPDRGWGLARTFALGIAAYLVWLGASLQLFRFRAVWSLAALLAVGLIGWWFLRRSGEPVRPLSGPDDRVWLHAELVFWLVFALILAFRFLNPDGWQPFWGGEKPMEFAQINAIGRSAFFPPYDPWYADGYINYYYYGFYLISFVLKATGIPAEVGFNLALPMVMGVLASGGFSVATALARALTRSSRLALLAGWIGAAALSVLGNLSAVPKLLAGGSAPFDPFIYWTWNGSRAIDNAITEFPFFSGLYADLHSHVIALPLTVAVVALAFATATDKTPLVDVGRFGLARPTAATAARLLVAALLLGSLSATNAWDVPVYAALTAAAVVMATAQIASWRRRLVVSAIIAAATLLAAYALFLPFHRHFVALFGSLALVHDPTDLLQFLTHLGGLLLVAATGLTVLLLRRRGTDALTSLWPWVALGAIVLGIAAVSSAASPAILTAGALLLTAGIAGPPLGAAWLLTTDGDRGSRWQPLLLQGAVLLGTLVAVAAILHGRAVFGLLFLLGGAAGVGWLRMPRGAERFVCLLVAAAAFTAAGVELVVVADDLIESPAYRMNTVFKFYNQVWVLLSLAGAALVAMMARYALARVGPIGFRSARAPWARLGVSLATLVLLGALTYPALATAPRLAQRFTPGTPSGNLNALAWMREGTVPANGGADEISYAGDAAAIDWLLANVDGSPVIAEASIGPYRCDGSRISSATGLPTIIGWERHEQQQRYPETLPQRVEDVRTLYTSPDPDEKASILRRYNVEYVIVGDLERKYPIPDNACTESGSAAGIAAFDEMVGDTLEVAFSSDGTTIYHVLPPRAG
jgi:YYY domain-containing protein